MARRHAGSASLANWLDGSELAGTGTAEAGVAPSARHRRTPAHGPIGLRTCRRRRNRRLRHSNRAELRGPEAGAGQARTPGPFRSLTMNLVTSAHQSITPPQLPPGRHGSVVADTWSSATTSSSSRYRERRRFAPNVAAPAHAVGNAHYLPAAGRRRPASQRRARERRLRQAGRRQHSGAGVSRLGSRLPTSCATQ